MLRAIEIIRDLGELRRCMASPLALDPRDRADLLEEIAELEARLALERERLPDDRRLVGAEAQAEPQAPR